MLSKLTEIKGVGDSVAKKLVTHYGSEEEAVSSLYNMEFDKLFSIPEVPVAKLIEIARFVYAKKHGFEYSDILKTTEAREVYSKVLDTLKEYAKTDYGRLKIGLFYTTTDRPEIQRRLDNLEQARSFVKALDKDRLMEVEKAIFDLKYVSREIKINSNDIVITESKDLYEKLLDFSDYIEIFLLERAEDIEYIKDQEFMRYVQTNDSIHATQMEALPQVEVIFGEDISRIIPEEVLSFYASNKGSIISVYRLLKLLEDTDIQKRLQKILDIKTLAKITENIQFLDEKGIRPESDEKLKILTNAIEDLDDVTYKSLESANTTIADRVETESVSLDGKRVLEMLQNMDFSEPSKVYEYLPPELVEILNEVSEECEQEIAKKLKLDDEMMIAGLFSNNIQYPLETDEEKLEEIRGWLKAKKRRIEFEIKCKYADELKDHIQVLERLIREMLELDITLALGRFSIDFNLNRQEIDDEIGIQFNGAKHLLLQKKELKGKIEIQPIDYVIGKVKTDFKGARDERIIVLTGANSGGKTTLLETITQIQIMTQMGLLAPANRAYTTIMDEIYYFGRNQGNDAGAFESLLRAFEAITIENDKKKLILADEIEAVTEPGAAAKVIASLLEWFEKNENVLLILVTHLGEDIKKYSNQNIRIDGIEAEGLDENLNLIVNRNPIINKLAKSTPELIVEKASKSRTANKDFYSHILSKFKEKRSI